LIGEFLSGIRARTLHDPEIQRVICSANAIESVNARIRRAMKAHSPFRNEQAALKCVYMAIMSPDLPEAANVGPCAGNPALSAFEILFDCRLTAGHK
jgi:transposase-like protein